MAYQRRKYKLVNLDNGNEIILDGSGTNYEPRNWDNSEREFKRSTKNFSITTELSKDLEFTGAGAKFLIDAYETKSVEANVKMYEYRYDNPNDWEYVYSVGDFDFSDYSREKNVVKVPFNTGGLNSLIKAKINDKFELNRETSITGEPIEPIQTKEFAVINRPLFLDSLAETSEQDRENDGIFSNYAGNPRNSINVPLTVVYESDDRFVSALPNQKDDSPGTGLASGCFYYNNNIDKIFNIDIDYSSKVRVTRVGIPNGNIRLSLTIYENGEDLDVKERIILKEYTNFNNNFSDFINVSYSNPSFELKKGESLSLQWRIDVGSSSIFDVLKLYTTDIYSSVRIQEDSVRNDLPRRANFVFNNDVGRQKMAIINNDPDTYKSEFFESSEFKLTGLTSGKWIRGFSDTTLTCSLKEFLDNSNALFNMGYNIEVINGKETLVHEPLKHFFRPETKIRIPEQVNNVKRSVAKEFIYNTIKSGYKKPSGDNLYEEVNGLNEFNTSNEYITPITRVIQDYDIESPFRADSEGKELTLRKSIKIFPTEDYRSDKTIFNLDLKNVGTNVYAERTWQDDYEEEPKNIFSPDTATGLRFTPFRNMERHFWFLNNAFTKFTNKYIRYSSTRGNSDLITKKAGETEQEENGDFQINKLENAIFVSEWIEFEYPLNSELLESVNGYTNVNGRRIPNTYYKVEFINEFNKKEYGYLFSLKPNKEGKWKLLKAL